MKTKLTILTVSLLVLILASGVGMAFDPVTDLGDVDFGGQDITYMCWYNPFEAFEEGGDYAGRLDEAKEKFNIGEINFLEVPWGDDLVNMAMSRLMGGDAAYDIWFVPTGHAQYWDLAAEGAFYPVNRILPEAYYEAMPMDLQIMFDELSIRGEIYAFGLGNDHYDNIRFMAWNKELFDREGLTPLDELWEQDELTWSAVEDIAIEATRDTTGDDEIDQWGLGYLGGPVDMVIANDGTIITQDEEGRFQFVMHNDEKAIRAVEKYVEWDTDLGIIGDTWQRLDWIDGNIAMAPIQIWQAGDDMEQLEFEWSVVPFPKGPDAADYRFPTTGMDSVYIPASARDPEGLVALHNFLYPLEEHLEGREETRTANAPDRTAYETYLMGEENFSAESVAAIVPVTGEYWDGDTPFGAAISAILWEGEDIAPTLNAHASSIQALLDEYFGQ